jgi:hypothetical protein
MEMTEKERLMLVEKKEEIRKLTLQNLDMARDPQNEIEIKKNFTSIISLLSQIASYSHTSYNLNEMTRGITLLFLEMSQEKNHKLWIGAPIAIEFVCNYVNSVKFNFTKNGLKISIPKMNINFGNITNK